MAEKYCIRKKSNPIEYWAGKNWTVVDSEVRIYDFEPNHVDDGEVVVLAPGKEYPTDEAIFERVKLLCSKVFGDCLVELNKGMVAPSGHSVTDSSVTVNCRIDIFWAEETRLPKHSINGSTLEPGYMVSILHSIPGSRWVPPDWDVEELGTYSTLDDAVKKAVELEAVFRVNDYLDYEADMYAAKADEDYERLKAESGL